MAVLVALFCCLGLPLISARPLTFGVDNVNYRSLYPVHYQLSDRYSLAQPHGRPGDLHHVDVDHVYNGHDIVQDDKDDRRYGHRSSVTKGEYNGDDSYDGGIEDRYNKAIRNAGNNDLYRAGISHLGDGFDFGVEKRYNSALKEASNKDSVPRYNKLGKTGYRTGKTGYSDTGNAGYAGAIKSRYENSGRSGFGNEGKSAYRNHQNPGYVGTDKSGYGNTGKSGYGNDRRAGYGNDGKSGYGNPGNGGYNNIDSKHGVDNNGKPSSGYGSDSSHDIAPHRDTGYNKHSGFGPKNFGSFGPGFRKFRKHGSYEVAPHVGDINLSDVHRHRSKFPQPQNTHRPYGNQYGSGNRISGSSRVRPTYVKPYPSRPVNNSYPPENNDYSRGSRQLPNSYSNESKPAHRDLP